MARGGGNRGDAGNRGNAGRTYGRAFRVFGRKKRKAGRPRKVRRALTAAFTGVRQAPAPEPVVDIEEQGSGADDALKKE